MTTRTPPPVPRAGEAGADPDTFALARRIGDIVAGVVAASARDAQRTRLVVMDDDSTEAELLARCLDACEPPLPVERVRVAGGSTEALRTEARRVAGGDGLVLNPANKTVAVLWPEALAEPVLPLADLYAVQVERLTGCWSAPADARDLIERAGGIEAVDAFLAAHLDARRPLDASLRHVPAAAAAELRDRLAAGWWWRRRLGVVPKLGPRTLGLDLR
jgi:hypothetical protein